MVFCLGGVQTTHWRNIAPPERYFLNFILKAVKIYWSEFSYVVQRRVIFSNYKQSLSVFFFFFFVNVCPFWYKGILCQMDWGRPTWHMNRNTGNWQKSPQTRIKPVTMTGIKLIKVSFIHIEKDHRVILL